MKDALDAFLASIPGSDAILAKHGEAVVLFGFFLSEILGKAITPVSITECYRAAHLKPPKNLSDAMSKSGGFVRDRIGWALQRDAIVRLKALVPTATSGSSDSSDEERRKTILVVYGQD